MADRPPVAPRWRLFLAAPVPERAATQIWSALEPLVQSYPAARWAKRDQLHATLVFLGQTDAADVERLTDAMSQAANAHAPFEVMTDGAGGHVDDRRGGVAWLRLDDGQRDLRNLARDLDWRIGSNVYAVSRPRPHVTVARRIDEALLADLTELAKRVPVTCRIDRIGLYRSHSDPGGSRYESLAERLLTGDRSTP
jgi:RNA 2',3'-cyclic 3'-phosphodiesterase